ncbi:unnamed protein product [Lepeophtheirus salmonis]|uniref:(salmon louse) hypothetical protein n=1 Tax=Lepeophtheirus salmonis TaxID=72036 RepID=A0A7R8CMB6_LEPSM|nr:unnamed protein product [Lepeophtheirus salmonis]CAF2865410.1 unnamed protein product [Lepeophtheirus salmonis]
MFGNKSAFGTTNTGGGFGGFGSTSTGGGGGAFGGTSAFGQNTAATPPASVVLVPQRRPLGLDSSTIRAVERLAAFSVKRLPIQERLLLEDLELPTLGALLEIPLINPRDLEQHSVLRQRLQEPQEDSSPPPRPTMLEEVSLGPALELLLPRPMLPPSAPLAHPPLELHNSNNKPGRQLNFNPPSGTDTMLKSGINA